MGKSYKGIYRLLLIASALGSTVSLPVQAESLPGTNGIIIIKRDVQPRNAMIPPLVPDPDPTTVNANPSQHILKQTNELSDGDFANVASGAGINRLVAQGTNNLGGNITNQTQLTNLPGGRSGNGGNGIANMVNSSVEKGLSPMMNLLGGQK